MHHVIFSDTTDSLVCAHFWTTGSFPSVRHTNGFYIKLYVTEVRLSALFQGLIKVLHEPFSDYKGFKFTGQLTER